jgi:hypothetical protein
VASDRKRQPLSRDGHLAELPSEVPINDALADYAKGAGVNNGGAVVRWQLWDHGRMGASG